MAASLRRIISVRGSDDVKLLLSKNNRAITSIIRIWNARGNFPAFSKSDKIDSTEEVGNALSENYKQAKDAVKDKSLNIANLMSTSLKVAIENKSNKKQNDFFSLRATFRTTN